MYRYMSDVKALPVYISLQSCTDDEDNAFLLELLN